MKNDLPNSETAPATTLSESVRIPLHSLQADLEYLIGRVVADGSCGTMIIRSMRERLDQIETALVVTPFAGRSPEMTEPVETENEGDAKLPIHSPRPQPSLNWHKNHLGHNAQKTR